MEAGDGGDEEPPPAELMLEDAPDGGTNGAELWPSNDLGGVFSLA